MLSIPSYAKTDNVPNSNEEEQIDQVDNIESDNNEPDENESDDTKKAHHFIYYRLE